MIFLSNMHFEQKTIEYNKKLKRNFHSQNKAGVDSHDHKFYFMLQQEKKSMANENILWNNSALVNNFLIIKKNNPRFRKSIKACSFLELMVRVLIVPHAKIMFEANQTPK